MKLIEITKDELSKVEDCALNVAQLNILLGGTPKNAIYERPAKGGGTWKYVTGTYVKKVLNLTFGWDWSFEVKDYKYDLLIGQVFVHGKLTVRSNGKEIVKEQFGRQDIKFKTDWSSGKKQVTDIPLDLGNDLKAATTDALKKCASELGIASDVYAPNEFKAIRVLSDAKGDTTEDIENRIKTLLNEVEGLDEGDRMNIERILDQKELTSYSKVVTYLESLNTKE